MEFKTATMADFDVAFDYIEKLWTYNTYDKEVIRKIQMIFQDPMASLNERAKVEYIIAEGLLNHHLYKDQEDLHEKVMNALHEVGLLPEFASRFPHEFSGGQRQRIGIARALVMEPEFIIADEPTGNIDPEMSRELLDMLVTINGLGKTVIVVTHEKELVDRYKKRVVTIEDGRIVSDRIGGSYDEETE